MAKNFSRRYENLSNTSVEGELCLYTGHSLGRFSSASMRYDSHNACIRCVAAAREGRLSLDISRLMAAHRKKALKFWSQVDIGSLDECWNWIGCLNKRTQMPQFSFRRLGISTSTQHHPQRVAMWLSWGDLGITQVKPICGNRFCCNPFHLVPQKIGVFVDQDSYIESFELACQLHTLKQQVAEYVLEEALKAEAIIDQSAEIDARADLLMNPDTTYAERFEAAIEDMLSGRHISQTERDTPGLQRKPDEDEENPTSDY